MIEKEQNTFENVDAQLSQRKRISSRRESKTRRECGPQFTAGNCTPADQIFNALKEIFKLQKEGFSEDYEGTDN